MFELPLRDLLWDKLTVELALRDLLWDKLTVELALSELSSGLTGLHRPATPAVPPAQLLPTVLLTASPLCDRCKRRRVS